MIEKINSGRHYTDMSADSPAAILNEIWAAIKKANAVKDTQIGGEKGGCQNLAGEK